MFADQMCCFGMRDASSSPSALNNFMMQSHTLTRGNVVVDVEVDIYYDALEYDINDAADETFIDVGLSPIHVRGGAAGSDEREGRSRTNRAARAKRNLSPKRAFQATTAKMKGTVQKIKTSLSDSQPSLGLEEEDEALTPIAANDRLRGSAPDQEAAVPPLPLTDSTIKFAAPEDYDPPPPPDETPLRFLRAGKDDPVEGRRRYEMTLAWRKEIDMDHQIRKPSPHFATIKQHYPQFFHLRGRNNEPVWYERPPGVNLRALREAGVNLEALLLHYATVTEFGWQCLETDDMGRSITVIDLDGMRMTDFAGEVVDFTRKCSASTGDHYPERAGHVIVVNVPSWFKMIWNVVKGFIDDVTLQKISIVRGKKEVHEAMLRLIPIENIPPEYGGQSMPLGLSPEEQKLKAFMMHNNAVADGTSTCNGVNGNPPCEYCTWAPVRPY